MPTKPRAAKLPPYKARRRQRERAAFVQSIRLHGGDGSAVSAHDAAQCAAVAPQGESLQVRAVSAHTAPEVVKA